VKIAAIIMSKNFLIMIYVMLSFTLSGCASQLRYVGKNFVPSQSLCADALVVNLDAAGCNEVYYGHSPTYNAFKVRCVSADWNNNSNEWLSYSFFLKSGFDDFEVHNDLFLICSDASTNLYFLNENSK